MKRRSVVGEAREFLHALTETAVDRVLSEKDIEGFDEVAESVRNDPDPRFAVRFHHPDSGGWYLWVRYRVASVRPEVREPTVAGGIPQAYRTTFQGIDILSEDPATMTEQARFSVPSSVEGLRILPVQYRGKAGWPALNEVFLEDNPDHAAYRLGQHASELRNRGRSAKALKTYDRALEMLRSVPATIDVDGLVASLTEQRGMALEELGRRAEAVESYDDVIRRFRSATDPPLQLMVARALLDKGNLLFGLGSPDDGFAAYDEVIDLFGGTVDPDLLEQVGFALSNRSEQLRLIGRSAEAAAADLSIADRFLKETDPRLVRVGAAARIDTALRTGLEGDFDAESELIEELLEGIGGLSEPALQEQIARAMRESVRAFAGLGDEERARSRLGELRDRFEGSADPAIRSAIGQAELVAMDPYAN